MKEAERALQSRGCQDIVLWVLEDNAAARQFYEAMGFHLDGESRIVELGKPLTVVRYKKVIE